MSIEQNKAIARRFYELFNANDLAGYDELCTPDFLDHNPVPNQAPGVEGLKQVLAMFRSAFSDLHVTIEDPVSEGDEVVLRIVARGTHDGEFLGIPPTGRPVEIRAIDIYRIADGKIREAWHIEDLMGVMQQLGVMPAPQQRNA